jgi:anti-sigma factor RsiW
MKPHRPELMTALLDGELKGLRRRRLVRHLRLCPVCAAEYRRQRHVRRMLRATLPVPHMSDSAEFFWSKVKTEIQRRGQQRVSGPAVRLSVSDWLLLHRPVLATTLAAVVAVAGAVWLLDLHRQRPAAKTVAALPEPPAPSVTVAEPVAQLTPEPPAVPVPAPVEFVEVEEPTTVIPNAVATVFNSKEAEVTVIWLSGLPWTQDMAELKTVYATLGS